MFNFAPQSFNQVVMENNTNPHAALGSEAKCPFSGAVKQVAGRGTQNVDWWPNQLKL